MRRRCRLQRGRYTSNYKGLIRAISIEGDNTANDHNVYPPQLRPFGSTCHTFYRVEHIGEHCGRLYTYPLSQSHRRVPLHQRPVKATLPTRRQRGAPDQKLFRRPQYNIRVHKATCSQRSSTRFGSNEAYPRRGTTVPTLRDSQYQGVRRYTYPRQVFYKQRCKSGRRVLGQGQALCHNSHTCYCTLLCFPRGVPPLRDPRAGVEANVVL